MNKNNKNMMMKGMGINTMINMMNNMNQLQKIMMDMMKNSNNNYNNYNNNIIFNNSVNKNNNNNEDNNNLNDEKLTIIFQRNKKNENADFRIKIICKYDELVKDILDRYCFKTNELSSCCNFNYNILKCYPENYITLYYNKNITYENGFQINKKI